MKTFNRDRVINPTFQTLYLSSDRHQLTNLITLGLNVPMNSRKRIMIMTQRPQIGYCNVKKI